MKLQDRALTNIGGMSIRVCQGGLQGILIGLKFANLTCQVVELGAAHKTRKPFLTLLQLGCGTRYTVTVIKSILAIIPTSDAWNVIFSKLISRQNTKSSF